MLFRSLCCVVPNRQRIRQFSTDTGRRPAGVLCVWNCPTRQEVALSPSQPTDHFIVVYQGALVPSRLPLTVLQALATLPDTARLQLVGYETVGHPGYRQRFLAEATRLGIAHRIDSLGVISTREALCESCRRGHVGLALMPTHPTDLNEQCMVGASNKPFEYLAAGQPVLVTNLPDWCETYVAPGYGLACNPDDPADIAQAFRWLFEHPEERHAMGERGRQQILQEWHYERQFQPVLELLTRNHDS